MRNLLLKENGGDSIFDDLFYGIGYLLTSIADGGFYMTEEVKVVIKKLIRSKEEEPVYDISSIGVVHVNLAGLIATESAKRQLAALDELSKLKEKAPAKRTRK